MKRNEKYFGIADVDVLADLGGYGGTEMGDRSNVVYVVDFHDGG